LGIGYWEFVIRNWEWELGNGEWGMGGRASGYVFPGSDWEQGMTND